ncbi:MAG: 30S ribosomal protein S20, partial [Clostridia bacterium]|nr:30S ribosomal protein S20 [Clostridia bacterium]
AINDQSADMGELVGAAVKKIDQAAGKGILHPNNAARKKSALVTRYNKVKA